MNYDEQLLKIRDAGLMRELRAVEAKGGATCNYRGQDLINLASNDYLGLANDMALKQAFIHQAWKGDAWMSFGASSSRLLTGNTALYEEVEELLCQYYKADAALFFNSGYHANMGILPALTEKGDLILSDKLCHASIIDGIRLSQADHVRFRHLDYGQLNTLLEKKRHLYKRVFIVVESVYSMDGDAADLAQLVALKEQYDCLLYVDEAHAVGAVGDTGLGLCEQQKVAERIDIVVGTMGKAYASVGAFAIMNSTLKRLLVNKARTLIYTTALPPVNMAWTKFIIERMPALKPQRQQLNILSTYMHKALSAKGYNVHKSHIVPVMVGDNKVAVQLSEHMYKEGFLVFPIRPPTVPVNTTRLRISLTADMSISALEKLMQFIPECKNQNNEI
ncbi:8-amino-7-oxononanoate synthase [Carboxylicivirga sp. A043]|uniref:aminotransferase class I/II-fold pyridoxal phosphate-dependent enzyme n=1 Tax=Carboxylicivirga litoralis TaxID=2816963 RepID=UPI0021CB3B0E|nr:8-amino-7-oxononanoate synthase [Carboxylicivirga sp. A043]MCU4156143.1 8-amino-7-oxononanoate synthase [Carboxylicivirga sp. A043]